jgi:hypothetical protein
MADDDHSADARYCPYVLASIRQGDLEPAVAAVQEALTAGGFTIAGTYRPCPTAAVLVLTTPDLQQFAAQSARGGFGAAIRVGLTVVGGAVQISYTNPKYMAFVYRMNGDNEALSTKMAQLLGREREFGSAKGLTEKKLRKYQYKVGMEYFDEPETLGKAGTYEEALQKTEAALDAQVSSGQVVKVCRIDIPGKKETLFCCGTQSSVDKFGNDAFIMSKIDTSDLKHTAYMPYEILVSEHKVLMLHARFRIAISFPDLSMMGEGSFMSIMDTPKALKKTLTLATGNKE